MDERLVPLSNWKASRVRRRARQWPAMSCFSHQVLFGSDWPHPEGTKTPGDYLACLDGCSPDVIQRVMRGSTLELLGAA